MNRYQWYTVEQASSTKHGIPGTDDFLLDFMVGSFTFQGMRPIFLTNQLNNRINTLYPYTASI